MAVKNNCWISQPPTCSSDFMHRLMAEAVVLWGESVPVPFCSTSCHWECGQQRAAWMHKYKLEGRIRQSSPASAGFPACRSAPVQLHGAQRAGDCDQHKLHHRATRDGVEGWGWGWGNTLQGEGIKEVCNWPTAAKEQVIFWERWVKLWVGMFVTLPRQVCETGPSLCLLQTCVVPLSALPPQLSLYFSSLSLSVSLLPTPHSSLSLPPLSPWLKMNLPACARALHHCQVPHGGPPPLSQTGHQPLAGIIPHLQKLSPLFLNKCGCSNRGVLLIHLSRVVWERVAIAEPDREPNKPQSL